MSEHFQASGYRLKLENCNSFFKAWLQKNFITKAKLITTFIYAAFLATIPWANRGWGHFDAASIIASLLFSIFLVFIILPVITYVFRRPIF